MSEACRAIVAALPREVRGLLQGVRPDPGLLLEGIHLYLLPSAVVVTAGMGSDRVALALEAAAARSEVREVVSVGLAGACHAAFAAGTVLEVGQVIDARTGERFATAAEGEQARLVTTDAIAGVREKVRLYETYGAAAVDMEAATLARLALARGLRFRAIKGISDAHDFELASLARFAGAHGQFRTGAFALHTALRPHHWRFAAKLGRDSNRALEAMHARLREVMSKPLQRPFASKLG